MGGKITKFFIINDDLSAKRDRACSIKTKPTSSVSDTFYFSLKCMLIWKNMTLLVTFEVNNGFCHDDDHGEKLKLKQEVKLLISSVKGK